MDLTTADDGDDRVSGLLQREPLLGERGMILRHLQEPGIAEEVRCVQEVDVEPETLDPLAAVDEPTQVTDRALVDRHSAGVLHRPDRAHLVRDRADAADPRGDVGRLGERPAAQERLKEPRRLVDPQLAVDDLVAVELHVHRALALNPGEVVGADRAACCQSCSWRWLVSRNGSRIAL